MKNNISLRGIADSILPYPTKMLARTIADLGGAEDIQEPHLLEALQYRNRDSLG